MSLIVINPFTVLIIKVRVLRSIHNTANVAVELLALVLNDLNCLALPQVCVHSDNFLFVSIANLLIDKVDICANSAGATVLFVKFMQSVFYTAQMYPRIISNDKLRKVLSKIRINLLNDLRFYKRLFVFIVIKYFDVFVKNKAFVGPLTSILSKLTLVTCILFDNLLNVDLPVKCVSSLCFNRKVDKQVSRRCRPSYKSYLSLLCANKTIVDACL